jgi:hypothetical protein
MSSVPQFSYPSDGVDPLQHLSLLLLKFRKFALNVWKDSSVLYRFLLIVRQVAEEEVSECTQCNAGTADKRENINNDFLQDGRDDERKAQYKIEPWRESLHRLQQPHTNQLSESQLISIKSVITASIHSTGIVK